MGIVLDIILLAVFIAVVVGGIRKGVVRSLMNIVSFVGALLCAYYLSPQITDYVREKIVTGPVAESISNVINRLLGGASEAALPQMFSEQPSAFLEITDRYQIASGEVEGYYRDQLAEGVSDAVGKISEFISRPVVETLSSALSFLAVFLIGLLVFRIVILLIDLACRLPVLNFANRFFGGVLGAVCGYLLISVLALVAARLIPALSTVWPNVFRDNLLTTSMLHPLIMRYNVFQLLKLV